MKNDRREIDDSEVTLRDFNANAVKKVRERCALIHRAECPREIDFKGEFFVN